jgi:hypothetical protein
MNAMVVASAVAAGLLFSVEPLHLGLEGVWAALVVLMVGRLVTLGFRFQAPGGPLPPAGFSATSAGGDTSDTSSSSSRSREGDSMTGEGGSSSSSTSSWRTDTEEGEG